MKKKSEKWKPCPGYPHYYVSNQGNVKSIGRDIVYEDGRIQPIKTRILKAYIDKEGYYLVSIKSKDGKYKTRRIHRLVLEAFIGPCPKNMEARHTDGDPSNNKLSNLTWSTHIDNMHDQKVHGTIYLPSNAKISKKQILAIRKHFETVKYGSIDKEVKILAKNII